MTNQPAANRFPDQRNNDQLKNKIQQRQARVGIIGLGYVGLPLALLFSEQKFKVTGFDYYTRPCAPSTGRTVSGSRELRL